MKETVCQDAASSPALFSQRSMPSTQKSETFYDRFLGSSKQLTAEKPEMFQNREILLKMLQPPSLYLSESGCQLPYHEEEKKSPSSGRRSQCFRCIKLKPLHIPVSVTTEANEDWSGKTKNGMYAPQLSIRDQHRGKEEKNVQSPRDIEIDMDLSYHRDLLKNRPFEKTRFLFPKIACCPSCEFSHEQFRPRTVHSQSLYGQKHLTTGDSFQKETLPIDGTCALANQKRKIEVITQQKSKRALAVKDRSGLNPGFLPDRCYFRRDFQVDQASDSNEKTGRGYQDKQTASAEVSNDDHSLESSINGLSNRLHGNFLMNAPCRTQDNHIKAHFAVSQGSAFVPSRPSQGLLNYQGHEERNKGFTKACEKQGDARPCCPDKGPQEECTPVIVQCYSLSEPYSRGGSQKMSGHTAVTKDSEWVPQRHVQCASQEPPLNESRSFQRHQGNESVLSNSAAFCPVSQLKNLSNEDFTTHVAVNNERQQNGSGFMSPNHVYTKFSPPAKCHCPSCQSYRCTQEIEHNNKIPEIGGIPKSSSLLHIPSAFQKVHSAQDGQNDVASEPESFHNAKQLATSQRATLKIRDYYEERRVLVKQIYPNIPGSREDSQTGERPSLSYARKIDGFDENHHHRYLSSAVVFQDPVSEKVPFRARVRQQDFVAGSKKRKNRQPRYQRVREDDPTHLGGKEKGHVHFEDNQHEEPSENGIHPQANPSNHHDPSITNKGSPVTSSPYEDESSTVPAHHGWLGRFKAKDCFIKDTPSRSQICGNAIPSDTQPPCHPLSKGKRTAEIAAPMPDTQKVQNHDASSFGEISREYSFSNQFSLDHEKSAFHQLETPYFKLGISYGKVIKCPSYLRPEWKLDPQHCYFPKRLQVSKMHFETLDKRRTSLEGVQKIIPSPVQVALGPHQLNINREGGIMDPCNHQGISSYAKRRAVQAKESPQKEEMPSPSSLSTDQDGVTSDDVDELQKTHISEQPHPIEDANTLIDDENLKRHIEEKNVTFPEGHSLFFKKREVYDNFLSSSMKDRRFVCRFCCKKFAHFSTLQNHVRTHTGDKPFQCKFCSRRFAQSGVLKAHLRTHTGDKPFVCMYCGKMFAQSTTLTNHLRTHTGQKPYVCHYCGKCFSQPSTLRKHELSHTKERPYSCKFCGKAFAQQSTLTNHMRSHTGQRPYKCHFCEKSFAQLSTLDRHLRLHSSVSLKPHQCHFCSKSFSYFSNLTTHMQIHEQEQSKVI